MDNNKNCKDYYIRIKALYLNLDKMVYLSEFSYKLYLKFLCDRLGVGGAAYLGGDRLLA